MREMKDSKVKWLGVIPLEWKVERVKHGFIRKKAEAHQDNPIVLSLARTGVRERDISNNEGQIAESYYNYNPVDVDDLLINPMDLYSGANCSISKISGVISPAYVNLRYREGYNPQYYDYYFKLQYWLMAFFAHGKGVSYENRWTLNAETLMNYPIIVPTECEQRKIVDYLDAKCSKIDEIIEKQLSIIEKLKEYKLSIITEAVTSGINPDVEMKDSGSVWFGNIPINWEMKRLKYVFHIQKDIAGEEGHTVLSITQRGIIPKDFSNNEGQFANSYANYQLVHKGDFAMNHMDLLTGWVDISKYEGVTSPDYRVFVLNDKNGMCPKYYLYMMQMCYSARIFYGLGQGVSGMGRWRLQADKFLNFYIPIPPYDEQKKIADYITDKVNHIEVEIDKRNKLIKKYQEYKKSLIYEVVTGKK